MNDPVSAGSPPMAVPPRKKSASPPESAKNRASAANARDFRPLTHEEGAPRRSDSFAEFLSRLQARGGDAARELFGRFTHQLVALALRHIGAGLRHKVEAEDVVQSAYKSLFVRYGAGDLDVANWNSLWGLLTLITVRKCAERAAYHRAGRRDAAREAAPPGPTRRRRGRSRSAASRR
jgi:hypothetical protein